MFALLLILFATTETDPRPGPWPPLGYSCPRAAGEIVIDGVWDEESWAAAETTEWFVDIEGDRQPEPRLETFAKMLWDDEYFYVAAKIEDHHLWGTLKKRDSVIYYDNDFEVFLDPDGDSHLYTEIELNALNTVWDLLLIKPYRDGGPAIHAWDIPGLKTAVALRGTLNDPSDWDFGWTLEIAIPFAVIAETTDAACPPEVGDRWRVNFSRVQWDLEVVDGEYRKIEAPEHNWVWSPQREIAMHEPEHWGIVEFVETAKAAPPPGVENAAEWHLRYASYQLARYRDVGWPPDFAYTAPEAGPGQPGPVSYWSDGTRYTLRLEAGGEVFSLTEDGRFLRKARR